MRYLTPLLFCAATAWMWYYNGTHDSSKLVLPFVDAVFPALAKDPVALAQRSFEGAVVLTAIVTVLTILGHLRSIRDQRRLRELQADGD